MLGTDPFEVDRLLIGGRLRCPGCTGELRPWGHARSRGVRGEDAVATVRPRRSSCSGCRGTHVLLPASMLARRADAVVVIGAALLGKARGLGHRRIAVAAGRAVSTVRGWLRRFARRAESARVLFTALLHALDSAVAGLVPTGSVFGDALDAVGLAEAAATRLFGPRPAWEFASFASGGLLLAPRRSANTS